jgi:hypothetical protein
MAIKKPTFDQYAIDRLKEKLAEKMGWVIANKADCAILSEMMLQSESGYLSVSTLYRLFFLTTTHTPYKNTYDILCRFLGYRDSFDYLENIYNTRALLYSNGVPLNNSCNNLIYHSIENNAYQSLQDFFESIEQSPIQFKESISIALFDSLLVATKQDSFFKYFSGHSFVREFLFEKAHDPKFRIKNYDAAYLLYLKNTNREKDISSYQDYIFGNAVLFRHYFLNQIPEKARAIGDDLFSDMLSFDALKNELNIFPYIRCKAYQLWYMELTNKHRSSIEKYALYLLDLFRKEKNNLNKLDQKIVFHTLAETFSCCSTLAATFHVALKEIYAASFEKINEALFLKDLKYTLPYVEVNGLLFHRP